MTRKFQKPADKQAGSKERLEFEKLLVDLSARFVVLPHDQVDEEIRNALKEILEFFRVDRCALVQTLPGKTSWRITHVAHSESMFRLCLPRSSCPDRSTHGGTSS